MKNWKTTVGGLVTITLVILRILGVEIPGPDLLGHAVGTADLLGISTGVTALFSKDYDKTGGTR